MKRAGLAALFLLGVLVLAGCSTGSTSTTTTVSPKATSGSSVTTATSLLATTSTTAPSAASQETSTTAGGAYVAHMVGAEAVPPVSTAATGTATFTVASKGTVLTYVLKVHGITNPSVARMHEGAAGANGPTIATLYAGPAKKGSFTGTLARGTIRATNLGGSLKGKKVADLVSLMKAGKAYVLLGTTSHPKGAIRGQVK